MLAERGRQLQEKPTSDLLERGLKDEPPVHSDFRYATSRWIDADGERGWHYYCRAYWRPAPLTGIADFSSDAKTCLKQAFSRIALLFDGI